MKFFQSASMQSLDRETIASGISGEQLMSRACQALAGEMLFFSDHQPKPLRILCGPGNNGGDGFGLAGLLHAAGWPVEVWLCVPEQKISGDAAIFFQALQSEKIRIRDFSQEESWTRAEMFLSPGCWLVDALLGTGSQEAPRGSIAKAVSFLQAQRVRHPVWSIDLPSGLDPDLGQPYDKNCCVVADHTLTLGGPKTGFNHDISNEWTGSVSVLDLDFPESLLQAHIQHESPACLSDREARKLSKSFPRDTHKGHRGHLLLIGGSLGMTGAISLSARAALRSGCGLVTVLTPFSCAQMVDAAVPEAMVIHGKQGRFMSLSTQNIEFSSFQAVAIGPGMRANIDSAELLSRILKECHLPLVMDADALNVYATMDHYQRDTPASLWLTPHPGEMARLVRRKLSDVQSHRSASAQLAAEHFKAHVVLKGARSRMMDMAGNPWLNLNGNPGMATGGSGDVLTGILGSLIAQGVDSDYVLPLAVYLHGRAGDLAAQRQGLSAMLAGDMIDAIPAVLKQAQGR